MLTCNDANVLIVRTIDDALSGGERAALRRHLGRARAAAPSTRRSMR